MKRVRRGKDIVIDWTILTNNESQELTGRDLRLEVKDPTGHRIEKKFEIIGVNTVRFRLMGIEQQLVGVYNLTLWEHFGQIGQTATDTCGAIELVSSTCAEHDGMDGLDTTTVTIAEGNLQVGFYGASAYELWEAEPENRGKSYEDYKLWQKAEALKAAERAEKGEDAREIAEEARVKAETARESAEELRKGAEAAREDAEKSRAAREGERAAAEIARASAEGSRENAEVSRGEQEKLRGDAEISRMKAEKLRGEAETTRGNAEGNRQRKETDRESAEGVRKNAESGRETAEGLRKSAEEARAEAEAARETLAAEMKKNSDAAAGATAAANSAAENANNAAAETRGNVNVYNLGTAPYDSRQAAREAVPEAMRKYGLQITYILSPNETVNEQFIGTDISRWRTEENWQLVPSDKRVVSLEKTNIDSLFFSIGAKKDKDTGLYSFQDVNDLTVDDMAEIYRCYQYGNHPDLANCYREESKVRSILLDMFFYNIEGGANMPLVLINTFYSCRNLETVKLVRHQRDTIHVGLYKEGFQDCPKLRWVQPILKLRPNSIWGGPSSANIIRCPSLEYIKIWGIYTDFTIRDSPLLKYECIEYMVKNSNNEDRPITFSVCETTMSYLDGSIEPTSQVGGTREEWMALNQLAISRNISFAKAI